MKPDEKLSDERRGANEIMDKTEVEQANINMDREFYGETEEERVKGSFDPPFFRS